MGANGLKSDFGGHDNKHHQNIYAFVSVCFGAPMPFRYFHGFNDAFVNNTCAFERAMRHSLCIFSSTVLHRYRTMYKYALAETTHTAHSATGIAVGQGLGVGVYSSDCLLDQSWNVSQNRVLTQTGQAEICGKPWADWFSPSNYTGQDYNSTLGKWPSDTELVGWAELLLDFHVNNTY